MVLSDRSIRDEIAKGRIVIRPLGEGCVQPASVDLHLDRNLLVFRNNRVPYIDVRSTNERLTDTVTMADDDPFMLHPGEFVLGSTLEHVEVPAELVARLEGKSSLGRIGLLIHSTAGYVDPGWKGHLTLELSNVSNLPITLYHRMRIGQISFLELTTPAELLYGASELGSKYQGQQDPTPSRVHLDREDFQRT
jgi:dCTP deaminase